MKRHQRAALATILIMLPMIQHQLDFGQDLKSTVIIGIATLVAIVFTID